MGVKDTTIWVKPENQPWEPLGVETARGIWAEDVQLVSDAGGPASAQFTLHRDSRRRWPDLTALTPVEVHVGGWLAWSGQLKDTPSGSQAITVDCEGLQADLDKDLIRRMYVHNKLGDWKDARSFPTSNLARLRTNGQVGSGNGQITLGWGQGVTLNGAGAAFDIVAVTLDLGPALTARRISIDWAAVNPNPVIAMLVRAHDNPGQAVGPPAGTSEDIIGPVTHNALPATSTASVTTPRRCFSILMYRTDGASSVIANDILTKLTGLRVYASTAYESGNQSVLKADTVVKDALTSATTQIILDFTAIDPTSFSIPSLAPDSPQTARQLIQAANAYHNWQLKVTEQRRPVFREPPTVPVVKAGAGVAFEPEDSSAGSSEDIYTKVLLSWDTPEATKGQLTRTAAGSVVDRQGQINAKELQIASALPADGVAAQQIGDTWLAAHQSTPFKGSATITGPLEDIATGGRVEPERLLAMTGELLLFDGMIDPDTNTVGRAGRINQVTYTPADDVAKVTIDDSRSDVDALLGRLAVVTGSG